MHCLTGDSKANYLYNKTHQCMFCQRLIMCFNSAKTRTFHTSFAISKNCCKIDYWAPCGKGFLQYVLNPVHQRYSECSYPRAEHRMSALKALVPLSFPNRQINSTKAFTVWTIAYEVLQSSSNSFPQLHTIPCNMLYW